MDCHEAGCTNRHMQDTRYCHLHNRCRGCSNEKNQLATAPFNYCDDCRCPVENCRHPKPCKTHQCKFCGCIGSFKYTRICNECTRERCPICHAIGCTLHYCKSCGEYRGRDKCNVCHCTRCGAAKVGKKCPNEVCACGAYTPHAKYCADCTCKMYRCGNYAGSHDLCDEHRADCCPKYTDKMVSCDGKVHQPGCPTVFVKCTAATGVCNIYIAKDDVNDDSGDDSGDDSVNNQICWGCKQYNMCDWCNAVKSDKYAICTACTIVKTCGNCHISYNATPYSKGCEQCSEFCIKFKCCGAYLPRTHWMNYYNHHSFRHRYDDKCAVHCQFPSVVTVIFSVWARANILGSMVEVIDILNVRYFGPTISIFDMTPAEFTNYQSEQQIVKSQYDIAFAVGIIMRLPKDICLKILLLAV